MRYGNRIYFVHHQDISSEWDWQISLFVVLNIIFIIFLGGAYVRIRKFALRNSFAYVQSCNLFVLP